MPATIAEDLQIFRSLRRHVVEVVFLATLVPRIHLYNRFRRLESVPSWHWKTVNFCVEESCFTPLH
jgi:hypothetical protein